MSKYTPGPWEIHSHPTKKCQIISKDTVQIAHVWETLPTFNARLIAAAPEMLGTLQDVASYLLSSNDNADVIKMVEDARDAVKKATGEGMG